MLWPLLVLCLVAILLVYSLARAKGAAPARGRQRSTKRQRAAHATDEGDEDLTLILDRATLTGVTEKRRDEAKVKAKVKAPAPEPDNVALLTDVLREMREGTLDDEPRPAERSNHESRALLMYEAEAVEDERTGPTARVLVWAQADSDQGLRRTRNEDAYLVLPEQSVFAVADGMGGYEGGQVASALAVEAVKRTFESASSESSVLDPRLPRRCSEVASAMLAANRAVFEAARSNERLARMGTTLVTARFVLNKQRVYVGHVGDSRCYRLRDRELRQLTTDHTMEQLGFAGPRAKDLTRAIGMEPHLELDLVVDMPRVDDIYLLCSDGLTKMVDDEGIRDAILEEDDLEAAVYGLIERANDAGGRDNITVLLVKVLSAAAGISSMSKTTNATFAS